MTNPELPLCELRQLIAGELYCRHTKVFASDPRAVVPAGQCQACRQRATPCQDPRPLLESLPSRPTLPPAPAAGELRLKPAECRYYGPATGEELECRLCGDQTRVEEIHHCQHPERGGECVVHPHGDRSRRAIRVCVGCPDAQARDEESAAEQSLHAK